MSLQSKLVLELSPQRVECRQPGWLFSVNPSAKNNENSIRSGCVAANVIAIRPGVTGFGNEDSARPPCRADPWRPFLQFVSNHNRKVLSNQDFGDLAIGDFVFELATIPQLHRQFPAERKRKQQEDEPSKRARIVHVSHLAR